jgi:SpoVK/Ycf46/Vps4 family AAA+-type ATPase
MVHIGVPSKVDRVDIVKLYMKNLPMTQADKSIVLQHTAENSQLSGCTGAQLKDLCYSAALHALREKPDAAAIRPSHFIQAMARLGSSPSAIL